MCRSQIGWRCLNRRCPAESMRRVRGCTSTLLSEQALRQFCARRGVSCYGRVSGLGDDVRMSSVVARAARRRVRAVGDRRVGHTFRSSGLRFVALEEHVRIMCNTSAVDHHRRLTGPTRDRSRCPTAARQCARHRPARPTRAAAHALRSVSRVARAAAVIPIDRKHAHHTPLRRTLVEIQESPSPSHVDTRTPAARLHSATRGDLDVPLDA